MCRVLSVVLAACLASAARAPKKAEKPTKAVSKVEGRSFLLESGGFFDDDYYGGGYRRSYYRPYDDYYRGSYRLNDGYDYRYDDTYRNRYYGSRYPSNCRYGRCISLDTNDIGYGPFGRYGGFDYGTGHGSYGGDYGRYGIGYGSDYGYSGYGGVYDNLGGSYGRYGSGYGRYGNGYDRYGSGYGRYGGVYGNGYGSGYGNGYGSGYGYGRYGSGYGYGRYGGTGYGYGNGYGGTGYGYGNGYGGTGRYGRWDEYGFRDYFSSYGGYSPRPYVGGRTLYRLINGGRDAQLRCEFPGQNIYGRVEWWPVDDPRYNWQFRGRVSTYEYGGTATLEIRDVRPDDFGMYWCVADVTGYYGGYYGDYNGYNRYDSDNYRSGYGYDDYRPGYDDNRGLGRSYYPGRYQRVYQIIYFTPYDSYSRLY